jgi:hypothetical protein
MCGIGAAQAASFKSGYGKLVFLGLRDLLVFKSGAVHLRLQSHNGNLL